MINCITNKIKLGICKCSVTFVSLESFWVISSFSKVYNLEWSHESGIIFKSKFYWTSSLSIKILTLLLFSFLTHLTFIVYWPNSAPCTAL